MAYFNDPNLAKAFGGLAKAFAPPSGSDLYGYARAGAAKAEAERLAQLFQMALDKDSFDQAVFDRAGQAVGQWTPSQGYYGVDVDAATKRRGQDIGASTALQKALMDNQRAAITSLFGALKPGEIAPAVPQEFMNLLGMPAVEGRAGLPPVLNKSEWEAAQAARLHDQGLLSDDMIVDTIYGERTPVEVVGEDGQPRYMHPGEAARTGATAYSKTKDPAAEQRIQRQMEYLLQTGAAKDPVEARQMAIAITDNLVRVVVDPLTKEGQLVNVATGQVMHTFEYPGGPGYQAPAPSAGAPAMSQDEIAGIFEGERVPDANAAFGLPGAVTGLVNMATDSAGFGLYDPGTRTVQDRFSILREGLLSDIADAYQRQPPSWLLKNIRDLTPAAGSVFEGPESAQSKLRELRRNLAIEHDRTVKSLGMRVDPKTSQELQMRKVGLETSMAKIDDALRMFGGAQQPAGGAAQQPAEPLPQPGDIIDGYRFKGGDPADPNNWERAE